MAAVGFLRNQGLVRIGVAVVVVAGILVATFGAGYGATRALANDDSAWLRKGVTVVQVNGPSGRYDATVSDSKMSLAANVTDPMEILQEPDGEVYTVDQATKKVFRIDTQTMTPQAGPSGTSMLAQGSSVYVVNAPSGSVTAVDPHSLTPKKSVRVPGAISSDAIATDGTVYVGETDGSVSTVSPVGAVRTSTLRSGGRSASTGPLSVATAGTQAAAVSPDASQLFVVGRDGSSERSIRLPGPAGAPVLMGSRQPAGPLWLLQGDQLLGVSLTDGQTQQVSVAAGDTYGAPVPANGKIYLPDETKSKVLVFNAATLAPLPAIAVPAGAAGDSQIEVVVNDGTVWIDNPSSRLGVEVGASGHTQQIDKGTGDGVAAPAPARRTTRGHEPGGATTPTSHTPSRAPIPPRTSPPPTAPPAPTAPSPPITTRPPVVAPPPTRTRPTVQTVAVPGGLIGQEGTQACALIEAVGLTCSISYRHHRTDRPGFAVGLSEPSGKQLTPGAEVVVYEDEVVVPPLRRVSYATYCEAVDAAGLSCSPQDLGEGSSTAVAMDAASADPTPGTLVEPNTEVSVGYYDRVGVSLSPTTTAITTPATTAPTVPVTDTIPLTPAPTVTVPDTGTVPITPATTAVPPPPPPPPAPPAPTELDEYWLGKNIFYLTFPVGASNQIPLGSKQSATFVYQVGSAWPLQNGSCSYVPNTVPLYRYMHSSGGYNYFFFTADTTGDPAPSAYSGQLAVACVYPTTYTGAGFRTTVYAWANGNFFGSTPEGIGWNTNANVPPTHSSGLSYSSPAWGTP